MLIGCFPRDHEIASGFQRLVNKRSLPDYFEVIKEPMAFSTIRVSRLQLQMSVAEQGG